MTQLKTLAAERQKRFVMLNGTFKKKEDGLRERADAAERQAAEAERESQEAQAQAASAVEVTFSSQSPVHGFSQPACTCSTHLNKRSSHEASWYVSCKHK